MRIGDMFKADINRSINGVIKVAQDDEESTVQELSEYVVTRELSRHFADFFEYYTRAIDKPTDDTGVWVSGFFGSGKSHFLKMLSYLLSGKEVAGKPAIDYFDGKISDPMVYSQMKRAASLPTESILFNIDSKGGQWKEGSEARTALLRAFTRVFYEHLGFYGEDFKLAKLEQFVEAQGKTKEFREAFARINGGSWVENRQSYAFYEDDIVEVLAEVLGMSSESAHHWFDGSTDDAVAPDTLVKQIQEYTDRRARECGGEFRLLFMADEVGQFVGTDGDLMLSLQTLVEEIGSKCHSRVWVMVTSQEAIDEVTKISANDFSKIQGRFKTRLSLSSSSVDEVIKRRVLEKTDIAASLLDNEYEKKSAILKNLFVFEDSKSDLKGYAGATDFSESYPFVSYQFKIMPGILAEIRKHGNSGKHLSGGERSMLSGFQEAAQKVQEKDSSALVPFWRFYDTISTFLEHGIRGVIDRCERAAENGHGIQMQDVPVLKTLYLIRYINDVKPAAGNISILMVEDMDVDKVALRNQVKESLDRLLKENYIGRSGDTYRFLTDEEQDIAKEIENTDIDVANVVDRIKRLVFDGIYATKKYRLGDNDFPFDCYVDDTIHGISQGGMKLNVITLASELAKAPDIELNLKSSGQALVVLADDEDYYGVLENAARIEKYVRTKNVSQLPEIQQEIIRSKQKEAHAAEAEAQSMLERAIVAAKCSIDGRVVEIREGNAKAKLDAVLKELTSSVFTKANYIDAPVKSDEDILFILRNVNQQQGMGSLGGANVRAVEEVDRFLEAQARTHQQTSMGDIQRKYQKEPYGWREIDIAAVMAKLVAAQKVTVQFAGKTLLTSDKKMVECLRSKSSVDQASVKKRMALSEPLLRSARSLLKDFAGSVSVPEDEDGLIEAIRSALEDKQKQLSSLLDNQYSKVDYPGKKTVENGIHIVNSVLDGYGDTEAFLQGFTDRKDVLLDLSEDLDRIEGFFPSQQRLFDESMALERLMKDETIYLEGNQDAMDALREIRDILKMEEPYGRIKELHPLNERVRNAHVELLNSKKRDLLQRLKEASSEIDDYAKEKHAEGAVATSAQEGITRFRTEVNEASTLTKLDALYTQVDVFRTSQFAAIDAAAADAVRDTTAPVLPAQHIKDLRRSDICPPKKLSTQAEVEAYVQDIRSKLIAALEESGSIRLN